MATVTPMKGIAMGGISHDNIPIEHFQEAAAQTFVRGQFVKFDANKRVVNCADASTTVLGLALRSAVGTTDSDIMVVIGEPGILFEVSVCQAAAADQVTALSQLGGQYGLDMDGNGNPRCDISNTTQKFFVVKKFSGKDAIGDTNGRVLCELYQPVYNLRNVA